MLIVAHRGASALAAENTVAAFEKALVDGAEAVEFDVRLTGDDRLVITHDDDIERVTGKPGRISGMTLAQVQALSAGIPTFEQVVDLLGGKVLLYIEVKGAWTGSEYIPAAPVVDAIAPLIDGIPAVVSSFDVEAVSHAKAVLPQCPTGLASLDVVEADWTLTTAIERGFDECHVPEHQIDEPLLARARAAGKRVLGWTVNDPARAVALAAIGCDGVFSDDPAMIGRALSR